MINVLLDSRCYILTFVIIEAVMAAQSSFELTSVFREEAVVVFRYLISDGLKLKLYFICLIFELFFVKKYHLVGASSML